MRRIIDLLLLLSTVLLNLNAQSHAQWNLVFEDEFEGTALNTDNWSYCKRGTPDWNKYLLSSSQTVAVENGVLKVRAIKNTSTATDPVPYHTGGIESRGKYNFRYGKAEIKAKFNNGQGSWPAIWMMPENNSAGWPAGGEIDIMEHLNADNLIYQTVHSAYTYTSGYKNNPPSSKTTPINKDDWNVYGLEWYPDRIDFTLNGNITHTYPRVITSVSGQWPFDKEFYFILNMAAGGSWGGPVTESHLPFEMQVDWVRVYTPKAVNPYSVPAWSSSRSQNDAYWNSTYVKSITIKGADSEYNYAATQRPASYQVVLTDTLLMIPEQPYELKAEAFSLGTYSTSVVKQDIRYTCAYIFTDFDGDRFFDQMLPRVGSVPPSNSVGGNMETLSVTKILQSPSKNATKTGRIRLIYHNAWYNRSDASSSVFEGLVYDIPVRTGELKTSADTGKSTEKMYRNNDRLIVKDGFLTSVLTIFDLTGRKIQSITLHTSTAEVRITEKAIIVQIIRPDGSSYSQLI